MGRHAFPVGKIPDAVAVHPVHFEHVALRPVIEGVGDFPPVVFAPHEGQTGDGIIAHQRITQFPARSAHQAHRQAAPPGQRQSQGYRVNAPIRRRFGDDRIPRQALHQDRVHQHGHRIVPGGDVGDEADRAAPLHHFVDLLQIPAHPGDAPLHADLGLRVGLADFPDQGFGQKVGVFFNVVQRFGHPSFSFVQIRGGPAVEFLFGLLHRQPGRVQFDHRISAQGRRIDGTEEKFSVPRISPLAADQVIEVSFRSVGFGDNLTVLLDQGRPRGLGRNKLAQAVIIAKRANSSRSGSTNRRGRRSSDPCAKPRP